MNTSSTTIAGAMFVLLICPAASAAGVSYNFDEAGWINNFGTTENFVGSFTGTPEASGVIAIGDLSNFSAVITETNSTGDTKTIASFSNTGLTDFMFQTATNILDLSATDASGDLICLGATVTAGACGSTPARPQPRPGTPPLPPIEGLFVSAVNGALNGYTTATLTIEPVLAPVPVPAPASTPEPASLALCGGALLLISRLPRRRESRSIR
jgi:hypothetical protein